MRVSNLGMCVLIVLASISVGGRVAAPDNPFQSQIDAAVAAKALSDAQAAASNAQKAATDAQTTALKAEIGDVPASGYTGSADAATGAGSAEALLLGVRSLNGIADVIAEEVNKVCAAAANNGILLFGSASFPDFIALAVQKTQHDALDAAHDKARAEAPPTSLSSYAVAVPHLALAAVGLGLDAVNKILAFAKSDSKFANLDATSSDSMLLSGLAGALTRKGHAVELPYTYAVELAATENPALQQTLEIYAWGVESKTTVKSFQGKQSVIEDRLKQTPGDAKLIADLQVAKSAITTWSAFGDAVDAWAKAVTAVDDKGTTSLGNVLRQSAIKKKLDAGAKLLIAQVHKVTGTSYTKKSILSSLGGNPFFIMGGAVASYTLFDGKSGRILASSLLPAHSGYEAVDKIKGVIDTPSR